MTETYEQFPLSAGLVKRLRASESRASVSVQLAAAIPQPDLQTQASPSPQMTRVPYGLAVLADLPDAYWPVEPYILAGTDYTTLVGGVVPFFTTGRFYGYFLPIVGAWNPTSPGANTAANHAATFGATDGLGISYFPVVGFEAYFTASLGRAVGEDFGWEFWLRTAQVPAGTLRILEQASGGIFPYRIQMLASGLLRASRSDGTLTATVDSAQAVNDDVWHYVTVTKDGVDFAIAIDDNAPSTTTDTLVGETLLTVDGAIAGDGFIGSIDEIALYGFGIDAALRQRHLDAAAGLDVPV